MDVQAISNLKAAQIASEAPVQVQKGAQEQVKAVMEILLAGITGKGEKLNVEA